MSTLKVLWFNNKGYGFARHENDEKNIFLHRKNLVTSEKCLYRGQLIECEVTDGEKGPAAINIKVVETQTT